MVLFTTLLQRLCVRNSVVYYQNIVYLIIKVMISVYDSIFLFFQLNFKILKIVNLMIQRIVTVSYLYLYIYR